MDLLAPFSFIAFMSAANIRNGALFLILSELFLTLMAAVIKHVSGELPTAVIVFFRNIISMSILLPLLLGKNGVSLRTQRIGGHIMRALLGALAMFGFYHVVGQIPLAQAVLLKLTAPFFLPIIAFFWMGERIPFWSKVAIPLGFGGVLFVLQPDEAGLNVYILIGIGAVFLAALAKMVVRKLSSTEPASRIVFYFSLFSSVFTAIPLFWSWKTPTLNGMFWLFLLSLFGTLGQLCMTRAYRFANPARIGVYMYLSLIFSGVLGFWFWNEVPGLLEIVGSTLIIMAGLINLRGERSPPEVSVREYRDEDFPALIELFQKSILESTGKHYNANQRETWANTDPERFQRSLEENYSLVSELEGKIAAFGDITPEGYIFRMYAHPDLQNKGAASALLGKLEARAQADGLTRVSTDASLTARPFFEKQGYSVLQEQSVALRGVQFSNFNMQKKLAENLNGLDSDPA